MPSKHPIDILLDHQEDKAVTPNKVKLSSLVRFLESHGLTPKGSQESVNAADELLGLIRDGEHVKEGAAALRKNVHEYLQSLSTDEINTELDKTRSGLAQVFINNIGDINTASSIRSSNWFNVSEVWLVGRKKWDRRGAVGTHHYTPLKHTKDYKECFADLRARGYKIVAAEITDDALPLTTYEWDEKAAVVYGEESMGLSPEVLSAVDEVVYIPARGSVRSLNLSTTASIFAYDYHAKRGLLT